jgi:hypothetical protein
MTVAAIVQSFDVFVGNPSDVPCLLVWLQKIPKKDSETIKWLLSTPNTKIVPF